MVILTEKGALAFQPKVKTKLHKPQLRYKKEGTIMTDNSLNKEYTALVIFSVF